MEFGGELKVISPESLKERISSGFAKVAAAHA
jgi:hypothetical protein